MIVLSLTRSRAQISLLRIRSASHKVWPINAQIGEKAVPVCHCSCNLCDHQPILQALLRQWLLELLGTRLFG